MRTLPESTVMRRSRPRRVENDLVRDLGVVASVEDDGPAAARLDSVGRWTELEDPVKRWREEVSIEWERLRVLGAVVAEGASWD